MLPTHENHDLTTIKPLWDHGKPRLLGVGHLEYHFRGNTSEHVVFTKPQTSIAKLAEQVANHRDKHVKTSLFIVTTNGKPKEPVQGLITVWDLPGEG